MFKVPDMSDYVFSPPAIQAIPIVGSDKLFPVNRIFCVGRNYEAHAKEMGAEIDREAPFYFTKSAASISMAEGSISYAKRTQNYHYEMEMVLAIGTAGLNVDIAQDYCNGFDLAVLLRVRKQLTQPEVAMIL